MSEPRTWFLLPAAPPPAPQGGEHAGPHRIFPSKRGMDPFLLQPPRSRQRHGALVTQFSLWLTCGKEENGTPFTGLRDTRPPPPAERH